MSNILANKIRLITTKGKDEFVSSLQEELMDRLHDKFAETYINILENLYPSSEETINEDVSVPSTKEIIETKEKPIVALISSLQESIRDEKTIIHNFTNGDKITITHEDSRCLVNLHDSLNKINQEKMRKLMSENYSEYNKILQFSRKHTERIQK